ncbi:MAG: HIT family protein [Actinomycetota bacterium]
MVDALWAGWRGEYLAASRDPGRTASVFTAILASGRPDDETHIVHRGREVFAILNIYPYSAGHLLVLPYRQVADLADLTSAESTELWATVTAAGVALRREYAPDGLNVGINMGAASGGSVLEHLHVHVVPRWSGDANFLTTTANAKAIPEALDVTTERVGRALRVVLTERSDA